MSPFLDSVCLGSLLQGGVPNEPNVGGGTILGAVSKLGAQVVNALAPQFLALILINIIFVGLLVWHIDARADHTREIMQQLLDKCLQER